MTYVVSESWRLRKRRKDAVRGERWRGSWARANLNRNLENSSNDRSSHQTLQQALSKATRGQQRRYSITTQLGAREFNPSLPVAIFRIKVTAEMWSENCARIRRRSNSRDLYNNFLGAIKKISIVLIGSSRRSLNGLLGKVATIVWFRFSFLLVFACSLLLFRGIEYACDLLR